VQGIDQVVQQNFTIYRGTSPTLRFTRTLNGSISGATVRFSVRMTRDAADPLVLDVLGTVVDAGSVSTPGVVTVALTKANTQALSVRPYAFSLERVDTGQENLWTRGTMTVELDVRNAAP